MKQGSLRKAGWGSWWRKWKQSMLSTETLQALCLQWQVSSDRELEVKEKDWRREVEDMDIQMSQLEEEKKQTQTDLHLALSNIQTVNAGYIGWFLVQKAWKKMERKMQRKS